MVKGSGGRHGSYLPRERVSVSTEALKANQKYKKLFRRLLSQDFWSGGGGILGLWANQQTAIAFAAAYICSDKALSDGSTEAALIKMPTGTGKSGVVATITRCFPEVRRSIVLTPRTALTQQLKNDIGWRFWGHLGYSVKTNQVWSDSKVEHTEVVQLLPNLVSVQSILAIPTDQRLVVVGTLQAFDQVRLSRDKIRRKLRRGKEPSELDTHTLDLCERLINRLRAFDLAIVDEGHYEPAPSWSRSVRELDRPTILLSATPFRNDYKLFRVKGRFVCNYPFPEAVSNCIIRKPIIKLLKTVVPSSAQSRWLGEDDTTTAATLTPEDRTAAGNFVQELLDAARPILKKANCDNPKIIVRAGSFEVLELLQSIIEDNDGERPVLIHERIEKPKKDPERRRYQAVKAAIEGHPQVRFWLHQTKLLEGIDDPTFVAVAIFDPFTNSRQLVQQIGRVLRSTDRARKKAQEAHVLVPATQLPGVTEAWNRYLEFEDYCARDLNNIVPSEAYLPEQIVRHMPQIQYVGGQFRHRLPNEITIEASDILLPKRAVVFHAPPHTFDFNEARREIEEGILARNRFVVRLISGLPEKAVGWTFFTVDESPYLANHFITEWRFGVVFAVGVGAYFFVFDSDGVAFEPGRIDLSRASHEHLTKLLPESATITRLSANCLDISDRAIRHLTQRTRSFSDTFTDLLDPMLRPTAVTGFLGRLGRYLGVDRGKVVDAVEEYISITEYLDWTKDLERQLTDPAIAASHVFKRYAIAVIPDHDKAERPINILLDLTEEAIREYGFQADDDSSIPGGMLAYEDLCVDIENNLFKIRTLDGEEVECGIQYDRNTARYKILSEALNRRHPPRVTGRARRVASLTERINAAQSFRVLTSDENIIYMYGDFLKVRDFLGADGSVRPLENAVGIAELKIVTSEKGEKLFKSKPKEWATTSVFGLIKAYCEKPGKGGDNALEKALRDFDLILLDDDSQELGDFIAVGERRLAIIHAKANKTVSDGAVTKLQEVGRQSIASLAFCSAMAQVDGISDDRFQRPTIFNKKKVKLSRVFRNVNHIPSDQLSRKIREALTNPSYNREVWIVTGRLLDVAKTRDRAKKQALTNRDRQLFMFLESLNTACGRASAQLRIFGH